jgi:hypothetical protein
MIPRAFQMATAVAVAGLLVGCRALVEDDSGPPKPEAVTFQGAVDTKYAGVWTTENKRSTLELGKDGKLKIGVVAASPYGDRTAERLGTWLVNGTDLLLKYSQKDQEDAILRYKATLSGNSLTLVQGRMKSVYKRK